MHAATTTNMTTTPNASPDKVLSAFLRAAAFFRNPSSLSSRHLFGLYALQHAVMLLCCQAPREQQHIAILVAWQVDEPGEVSSVKGNAILLHILS
jgi:hypothetical protein